MNPVIHLSNVSLRMPDLSRARSIRQMVAKPRGEIATATTLDIRATLLSEISLSIFAGERIGLIGANGAGKSTFLRLLAGIYAPTHGEITVKGDVSCLLDLNVGFDLDASGYENIPIAAAQLGYDPKCREQLIEFVLNFTDLGNSLKLPIRAMSNGMQMRLAFAITVFSTASILLIDEIIGVGDSKFIEKATSFLKASASQKTLVLASHAEFMIHDFCTKAAVFNAGKIVFFGDTTEGFDVYKNLQ